MSAQYSRLEAHGFRWTQACVPPRPPERVTQTLV
jgi:hypothetical protein